jgi:carboxyl-terminal processing protease
MSLKTRGILVLVIGTVLGFSLSLGGGVVASRQKPDSEELSWEQARLFAEVMERVKHDYVEPIDDRELLESAIRGMVADLDAHSQYLDAREYQDIRISTSGSYSGVGIEVSSEDGRIQVVAPIDGTPAHRAGIVTGDTIVAIDDASVGKDGLQETISRMRGPAGSRVSVSILRGPEAELLVFNLRREHIRMASVRHDLLDPSLGYIRISQFSENTASDLSQAIDDMTDEYAARGDELRGLVLDLRNNPGGILDAAVDVSDLFLTSGVIVTAEGRTPEATFSRKASRGDVLDGMPMVVLVNKGSASASEIVAGALQDHHRALIVGTPTFGKGLVQTVMPLSKGRAIKLTTSRYFTPSGDSIHEIGIEPDIAVEGDDHFPGRDLSAGLDREGDPQLAEAIELLANHRIMQSRAP